jgi:membrane protease YdiL (CAAX protease family)
MISRIKKHPVLTYYVLAFAISWTGVLFVLGPDGFLNTTGSSPEFALAGPASVLGPSLACVLLTSLLDGRPGWRDLLARLRRWRVGVRWYAVALLTAPLVLAVTHLTLSLTSSGPEPPVVAEEDKLALVLSALAAGLAVPFFEELGWTGFAVPRLRRSHSILSTGLIMGVLWGAWHLPLFAGNTDAPGELPPLLLLAALLLGWLVPYRVLMVWVYDHTQSVLLVMLMHTPIVIGAILLSAEDASRDEMFVPLIFTGSMYWLLVGAVALANRGHLTHDRPSRAALKPTT